VSEKEKQASDPAEVSRKIAAALDAAACEYALGGAIALGFWSPPRGTLDVDVTLFLPPEQPSACIRLLQTIGCEMQTSVALRSLSEHGFCQVQYAGIRLDVFLPTVPFYELACQRRRRVQLGDQPVMIWDAETLCVFKMMFFRRKDLADVEQILRTGGDQLDRDWVREQLIEIYGQRDPRISQWQDLLRDTRANL
jgi:hypothetical protein